MLQVKPCDNTNNLRECFVFILLLTQLGAMMPLKKIM